MNGYSKTHKEKKKKTELDKKRRNLDKKRNNLDKSKQNDLDKPFLSNQILINI